MKILKIFCFCFLFFIFLVLFSFFLSFFFKKKQKNYRICDSVPVGEGKGFFFEGANLRAFYVAFALKNCVWIIAGGGACSHYGKPLFCRWQVLCLK